MARTAATLFGAAGFAFCLLASATCADEVDDALGRQRAKRAHHRGLISGVAKRCGLDWERRNFIPMMSDARAMGMDQTQTALAAALHGAAMEEAEHKSQGCDGRRRAAIERQLDYRR